MRLRPPTHSDNIFELAGGANANNAANLLLFQPDIHSMLDVGEFFVIPIPSDNAEFAAVRYEVAFVLPPIP